MSKNELGRSTEDYLEAILIVTRKQGACRMTDIARYLGYSKPSVSVALKKLEEEGFIVKDDWRVLLTEKGQEVAEHTYAKHKFFRKVLLSVGVDSATAEKEACLVEHAISDDSFHKMVEHWDDCSGKKTEKL